MILDLKRQWFESTWIYFHLGMLGKLCNGFKPCIAQKSLLCGFAGRIRRGSGCLLGDYDASDIGK